MIHRTHITGLPGTLPPGEHILWQGAPAWRSLARHLCCVRPVALYFAVVTLSTVAVLAIEATPPLAIARAALLLILGGVFVTGFLTALAWCIARTTEYTLTTQRLVIRAGLALSGTLAIPHRGIARAGIRLHANGTGSVPIETKPGFTVALHRVWPHARPSRLLRAQPMLLCVPEAGIVAALLARTLAAAESERLRARRPVPPVAALHLASVAEPELVATD